MKNTIEFDDFCHLVEFGMFQKYVFLQEALPEVETLRERLSEEKRKLDDELLKSAGLENQLTRMEEDLNFKMQLLEKELTEVRQ